MKTQRVTVVPYDPAWPQAFEAIKKEIEAALGDRALAIEHVGSTSVEGMWAKPCIDLDVVIPHGDDLPKVIQALASIGYRHEGDLGIHGREAFCYQNKPHLQKHHLYVCPKNSPELWRHLRFRDYLRQNPEAAAEYSETKRLAALHHPQDIDGYIQEKAPCIQRLYAACGLI